MTKLTIYKSNDCDACRKLVPKITEKARKRGWEVTTVDIDKCDTKECKSLSFVPTIKKDGKLMSDRELEVLMNGK